MKLQKWAIRIITGSRRMIHTTPLFKKLGLLKLNEIYVYFIMLLMYKFHHSKLPEVVSDLFTRNNSVHDHITRQHNALHVPLTRSLLSSRGIRYTGVKLYNYFTKQLNLNFTYACSSDDIFFRMTLLQLFIKS